MLNWLNRQNSTATATGYPPPPLSNWRNREEPGEPRNRTLEPTHPVPRKRTFGLRTLLSFAVVVALIVGVDVYIFGINKRLTALERQFVEVKEWAFPASLLEGKYASLNARVHALSDAYSGLNEKLASIAVQQQPVSLAAETPTSGQAMSPEYASLNARVRALSDAYSGLKEKLASIAVQQQPVSLAAETPTSGQAMSPEAQPVAVSATMADSTRAPADTELPSEAPAAGITRLTSASTPASTKAAGLVRRTEPETAPASPVSEHTDQTGEESPGPAADAESAPESAAQHANVAAGKVPAVPVTRPPAADTRPSAPANARAGAWVINLISDPNETLATRFAERARARGVMVEQNRTEVKGRVYWRVQITGFATASEARARAKEVKEKLNLKDVWVFRQTG